MAELKKVQPKSRAAWRGWLEKHHATSHGVWLVFAKKHTGLAHPLLRGRCPGSALLRMDRQPHEVDRRSLPHADVHAAQAEERVVGDEQGAPCQTDEGRSHGAGRPGGGGVGEKVGQLEDVCGRRQDDDSAGAAARVRCESRREEELAHLHPQRAAVIPPHGEQRQATRDAREVRPQSHRPRRQQSVDDRDPQAGDGAREKQPHAFGTVSGSIAFSTSASTRSTTASIGMSVVSMRCGAGRARAERPRASCRTDRAPGWLRPPPPDPPGFRRAPRRARGDGPVLPPTRRDRSSRRRPERRHCRCRALPSRHRPARPSRAGAPPAPRAPAATSPRWTQACRLPASGSPSSRRDRRSRRLRLRRSDLQFARVRDRGSSSVSWMPSWCAFHPTARYIAPVSMCR